MSKANYIFEKEFQGTYITADSELISDLRKICFFDVTLPKGLTRNEPHFTSYDGSSIARITVKERSNHTPENPSYSSVVEIEVMPHTANMQRELSDLLSDKGYVNKTCVISELSR